MKIDKVLNKIDSMIETTLREEQAELAISDDFEDGRRSGFIQALTTVKHLLEKTG